MLQLLWSVLGQSGQQTSVKCAEPAWITKTGRHSALLITCGFFSFLLFYQPVGNIEYHTGGRIFARQPVNFNSAVIVGSGTDSKGLMRKIHGEYYILSPGEGALKFTMCTHACPEVFKICLNKVSGRIWSRQQRSYAESSW